MFILQASFFKFIYLFKLEANYNIIVVFAIHWHESAMGVHVFPILNPPPHLHPHPIPQGHPSVPALSTLSHASDLDWQSISHMITYMFQCCSLKSSHPWLLPQSPKVCSLYLCLFCCLTYRVIITIFLNSIYMRMAPHSSTLAWKIPWTEEPGRLQSVGSLRVGYDWVTSLHFTSLHTVLVFFFLTYFTLYNRLQFHLPH